MFCNLFFSYQQPVVVSERVNLVPYDVQPLDGGGHEGKVEPGQTVVGHVEPLHVRLGLKEAVDVLQLVLGQVQGLEALQNAEGLLYKKIVTHT